MLVGILFGLAACRTEEPAPELSPEMQQQLMLTAMNTNRSVFTAPYTPVELKRVHLAEAMSWAEWQDSVLKSLDDGTAVPPGQSKPWMLEARPFLHSSGNVVLTYTGDQSEGMPDLEDIDPTVGTGFTEWMYTNEVPGRMFSISPEGEVIADTPFIKKGAAQVLPDPFHESAIIVHSFSSDSITKALNAESDDIVSFYGNLKEKYDLVTYAPTGEQLDSASNLELGINAFVSPGGIITAGTEVDFDKLTSSFQLQRLTPGLKRDWSEDLPLSLDEEASAAAFWGVAEDSAGNLYIPTYNGNIIATDDSGKSFMEGNIGTAPTYPPALSEDGSLILVTDDSDEKIAEMITGSNASVSEVWAAIRVTVVCLDPDGTERWRSKLKATASSAPALGRDGTVYLLVQQAVEGEDTPGTLVALDGAGDIAWSKRLSDAQPGFGAGFQVAVDGAGNVIASTLEQVRCFDPQGNELWQFAPAGLGIEGFVILPGNKLLLISGGDVVILGEQDGTNVATDKPAQ